MIIQPEFKKKGSILLSNEQFWKKVQISFESNPVDVLATQIWWSKALKKWRNQFLY